MALNKYEVGDRVNINTSTVFQDSAGTPFDPDTVTFKVKQPDGTVTSYVYDQDGSQDTAITKNGTGDYTLTIDVDAEGTWLYSIEGEQDSGENRGADDGIFKVVALNTG